MLESVVGVHPVEVMPALHPEHRDHNTDEAPVGFELERFLKLFCNRRSSLDLILFKKRFLFVPAIKLTNGLSGRHRALINGDQERLILY